MRNYKNNNKKTLILKRTSSSLMKSEPFKDLIRLKIIKAFFNYNSGSIHDLLEEINMACLDHNLDPIGLRYLQKILKNIVL